VKCSPFAVFESDVVRVLKLLPWLFCRLLRFLSVGVSWHPVVFNLMAEVGNAVSVVSDALY
jgi:hypothetical protein